MPYDISSSLHLAWAPKYRFKIPHGEVRLHVREIICQLCVEMGLTIVHGILFRDHVHMFVEIPPATRRLI
ncbi:transposase [Sphingobium sp. 15-1]|uniref:transposase n=1 Tax=Sphingobium sp. 15-1 TaxID=2729616 RepID=UPI00210112CB|nr:transposase [Sphingobium sp. 15-1]